MNPAIRPPRLGSLLFPESRLGVGAGDELAVSLGLPKVTRLENLSFGTGSGGASTASSCLALAWRCCFLSFRVDVVVGGSSSWGSVGGMGDLALDRVALRMLCPRVERIRLNVLGRGSGDPVVDDVDGGWP